MEASDDELRSGKAAGALRYLKLLSSQGHTRAQAAAALARTVSRVLETVEGEGWRDIDVRQIDVNDFMVRFGAMAKFRYASRSLIDYKSCLNRLLSWYRSFLEVPGWTPNLRERAVRDRSAQHVQTAPRAPALPDLIAFPFPLSAGGLATLYLPPTIRSGDARRMIRFVGALVAEGGNHGEELEGERIYQQPESQPGDPDAGLADRLLEVPPLPEE